MSDYREQHQAAVAAAVTAVGGLQDVLSSATESCDVAMGAVLAATGGAELESATMAIEMLRLARESVGTAYRQTVISIAEIQRYGNGF